MKKGFTLIELLVVISIVSILSSVVIASTQQARNRAGYAKAASDITTLRTALELSYQNNGDWPPSGSTAYYISDTAYGWPTLGNLLQNVLATIPYPSFPTQIVQFNNRDVALSGYTYYKGLSSNPMRLRIYNSATGNFVACVLVYNGYYLSFPIGVQNDFTLRDGGIDPDTIEKQDGDVRVTYDLNDCP